jgi:hypothetical protein
MTGTRDASKGGVCHRPTTHVEGCLVVLLVDRVQRLTARDMPMLHASRRVCHHAQLRTFHLVRMRARAESGEVALAANKTFLVFEVADCGRKRRHVVGVSAEPSLRQGEAKHQATQTRGGGSRVGNSGRRRSNTLCHSGW